MYVMCVCRQPALADIAVAPVELPVLHVGDVWELLL